MHTYIYPFSVQGIVKNWNKITGMESLLIREINARKNKSEPEIRIVSNETEILPVSKIKEIDLSLEPISLETSVEQQEFLARLWFDIMWAVLHPNAFSPSILKEKLAEEIYRDQLKHFNIFKFLNNNIISKKKADIIFENFAIRFQKVINNTSRKSKVLWADVFLFPAMKKYGKYLKEIETTQIMSCHLVIPEHLEKTTVGKQILEAISNMDIILLHTDTYAKRLKLQLETLKLKVPKINRFDLGIDVAGFTKSLKKTPKEFMPNMQLDKVQERIVSDILETQGKITNRFICLDRLDPIKGIHIVLEAVDAYLSNLEISLKEIKKDYRFYFLTDYLTKYPLYDDRILWHRYAKYVREQIIPKIQHKWKGVIFFSDNIPNRTLIAHLLKDQNIVSGGVQDGLNLAFQEGLFVNYLCQFKRSGIIGNGAGIAIRAAEQGIENLAFFPEAGSVSKMTSAIHQLVHTPDQQLLSNTKKYVEAYLTKRTTNLFDF